LNDETPDVRFASDPERLDREGLLALVRKLQRTVALQQQTIERQRTALAAAGGAGTPADQLPAEARTTAPTADPPNGTGRAASNRTTMRPVSGADYTLVFDGGSLGNPGRGYGSYQVIDRHGTVVAEERLEFGERITNNGAEFRTLIAGLEHLLQHLGDGAQRATLSVRGDSQLVINGVTGRWKIKHEDLKPLRDRAAQLLGAFGSLDIAWHARGNSVRSLGH